MTAIQTVRQKWILCVGVVALILLAIVLIHDITLPIRSSPGVAAIRSLRSLAKQQRDFRARYGCFASELGRLPEGTSNDHDYKYAMVVQGQDTKQCVAKFMITASPISPRAKDAGYFSIDENEMLRSDRFHPAGPSSPILE